MANTLNVIEVIGDSEIHVNSFVFKGENTKNSGMNIKKVKQAELLFLKLAEENGISEADKEFCLDYGFYQKGDYKLFLSWNEN